MKSMFIIGFGSWATFNIAYGNSYNPEQEIREQRHDAGALGYGGERVVEVKPFAIFFGKLLLLTQIILIKPFGYVLTKMVT